MEEGLSLSKSHGLESKVSGFLLVALGAALWGTDAIFRLGLALQLPAPTLVFLEHVVLAAVTLPVLWRGRDQLRQMNRGDWISALVVGAGSSTLATVLFTSAFRYGDPTTPLLLQKVQPLVAVAAASVILGERLLPRYAWFLAGGLTGAYLVAFPDPTAASVSALTPALLALGAAFFWGMGTVLGRRLSAPLSFSTLTALRFAVGLPAAALLVAIAPGPAELSGLSGSDLLAVLLLALVPGLLALSLYYLGLRSTPASAATLAELAFPLTAAGINYLAFGTVLTPSQLVGMALLAGTITAMSWLTGRGREAIGVVARALPAAGEA